MDKIAGSFSGSTVLPAQPKNLKLIGLKNIHKKWEFSKKGFFRKIIFRGFSRKSGKSKN